MVIKEKIMKKLMIPLLLLCMTSAVAVGCTNGSVGDNLTSETVISLSLSKKQLTIDTYQTVWLTVDYNGLEEVEWSVDDGSVLSVENGRLMGLKAGVATVTAKAGEFSDTCIVTVNGYNEELLSLSVADGNIAMYKGDVNQLLPKIEYNGEPLNTEIACTYISSDSEVIDVTQSGEITAKAFGEASVSISCQVDKTVLATTVNVEVISSGSIRIEQDGVKLYAIGEFDGKRFENSISLTAKAYEKGVEQANATVMWSVESNQDVITLAGNEVAAKNAGNAMVTATYVDKDGQTKTDTITVTVLPIEVETTKKLVVAKDEIVNGYEVDVEDLFDDQDKVLTGAWIQDGKLKTEISVQNNKLNLNSIAVGDKNLYVQTRNIACGVKLQLWSSIISTAADMKKLYGATDGWYCLSSDIDMSGVEWSYTQTSNGKEVEAATTFVGKFDGQGYTISNLTLNGYGGLFHTLSKTAEIKNVTIAQVKMEKGFVGGTLAKEVKSETNAFVTVENVFVQADNAGTGSGGFIGAVNGNLSLKTVSGVVTKLTNEALNGALFATVSGKLQTEDVQVYSGLAACGNSVTDNSQGATVNAQSLVVAPTIYKNKQSILDYETDGMQTLSFTDALCTGYTVYGNEVRNATCSSGEATLNIEDVEGRFGGFVDVIFEKKDGNKAYYSVEIDSTVYLTQANFEKYVKTQIGEFVLTEDIVLSGVWSSKHTFTGTFDGQGHSVKGLTVGASSGLFRVLHNATVKNLVIIDAGLGNQSGVLAYNADGDTVSVENVYISLKAQRFSEENSDNINQTYVDVNNRYKGGIVGRLMDESTTLYVRDCVVYMPEYTTVSSGFIAGFSKVPTIVTNSTFIGGNGLLNGVRSGYKIEPTLENVNLCDAVKAHTTYKPQMTEQNKAAYDANHAYIEITASNYETVLSTLTSEIVVLKDDITVSDAWNSKALGAKATFTGVFDGANHVINGIKPTVNDAGGLFYALIGSVKNIAIVGELSGNNA